MTDTEKVRQLTERANAAEMEVERLKDQLRNAMETGEGYFVRAMKAEPENSRLRNMLETVLDEAVCTPDKIRDPRARLAQITTYCRETLGYVARQARCCFCEVLLEPTQAKCPGCGMTFEENRKRAQSQQDPRPPLPSNVDEIIAAKVGPTPFEQLSAQSEHATLPQCRHGRYQHELCSHCWEPAQPGPEVPEQVYCTRCAGRGGKHHEDCKARSNPKHVDPNQKWEDK